MHARRIRYSASLHPPEPVRALSAHLLRATAELAPMPRWLERYPLGAISPSARQIAWAMARRLTRNADYGFAIAERVPAEAVGSLWPWYQSAPTLCELHERSAAVAVLLLDNLRCSWSEGPSTVVMHFSPDPPLRKDRAEEDFRAAMQVKIWRALHQAPELALCSAQFTYARPRSTREHEHVLGTSSLRFSQPVFQLELCSRWWRRPLPTGDRNLFTERYLELEQVARAYERGSLSTQVEAVVTVLLSRGPSAHAVASALGMSARTLRRRLADAGHSLRNLVDRARQREAALFDESDQLLGERMLSSTARARLLGFANPGALRNARRRWRTELPERTDIG